MTETEKMAAGLWYDANFDPELLNARSEAEMLYHQYNLLYPNDPKRTSILCKLLGLSILPDGLSLLAPVYFDYGKNTHLGKGVFINHGCYFMDGAPISIGDNCFIGPYCGFYTAHHAIPYPLRNKGLEKAMPITIGDNCWFGANVTVLPGVTIGKGCVIAAGSVVTADIPDDCIAAGVPAAVKKKIDQTATEI